VAEILEVSGIQGVKRVRLAEHADARGAFLETFRKSWFPERTWDHVQTNLSASRAGVLRGLHYHFHQVDYWLPLEGRLRVGLYDLRRGSPTRGGRLSLDLSSEDRTGIYVPAGVAHGFYTVTETRLAYWVDAYHDGSDEHGVAWDDPDIGLDWKASNPMLSDRDRANPRLRDLAPERLPA
jgi:dTDP-4-dehydrorhamnose 3,5-epimerase